MTTNSALPDPAHALLVARVADVPPDVHDWTGNEDDAGHHHGLVSMNEVPYHVRLLWHSRRAGRTVEVGVYRLNLRRLASAGYAQAKADGKVRLRFIRDADGVIAIQANATAPALPVGVAHFD